MTVAIALLPSRTDFKAEDLRTGSAAWPMVANAREASSPAPGPISEPVVRRSDPHVMLDNDVSGLNETVKLLHKFRHVRWM